MPGIYDFQVQTANGEFKPRRKAWKRISKRRYSLLTCDTRSPLSVRFIALIRDSRLAAEERV